MIIRSLFGIVAATTPALAGVSYTFDSDSQGWGILGDAQGFTWNGATGNNAPGSIQAVDLPGGDAWFFSAPTADLGNLSGLYGMSIDYNIMIVDGIPDTTQDFADLVLVGAGIEIGITFNGPPTLGQWVSRSAMVDASSGWRYMGSLADASITANQASEADIRAVLADLQGLYIRGEYTDGPDRAALDDVLFVPTPGAAALIGLGGLVAARRRRGS